MYKLQKIEYYCLIIKIMNSNHMGVKKTKIRSIKLGEYISFIFYISSSKSVTKTHQVEGRRQLYSHGFSILYIFIERHINCLAIAFKHTCNSYTLRICNYINSKMPSSSSLELNLSSWQQEDEEDSRYAISDYHQHCHSCLHLEAIRIK